LALTLAGCYLIVLGRLAWLGAISPVEERVSMSQALPQSWTRPDIVDREGRLIATDILSYSLFADPALIADPDDIAERLNGLFPDLPTADLRRALADKSRRFHWIKRGLTPRFAQAVHDLGEPGLGFRREPKRAYPLGRLASHVIGSVNADNRGVAGIERGIDERGLSENRNSTDPGARVNVALSLDAGVQHALEQTLVDARLRYSAKAAAGLVMNCHTGELVASASLPSPDPTNPGDWLERATLDRVSGGVYELGSVFKIFTIAMALDSGTDWPRQTYDVREPLNVGPYTIKDTYPAGRPLSLTEIFTLSSNVGAGMIARDAGAHRQRAFLERAGLFETTRTEAGLITPALVPDRWGDAEMVTIGYGHGVAVAPLQFAAAAAALINGGTRIVPTYFRRADSDSRADGERVISASASRRLRDMFRLNVTSPSGTGRRIEPIAAPYRVGGKTGTADLASAGGYRRNAVISSFVGAFPMDDPRYLTLVVLFEPRKGEDVRLQATAGLNAAPTTGRLVARIAPMLGIRPTSTDRAPMQHTAN